jgi:hypothetical protein
MKKYSLLLLLMIASVWSYAATLSGSVQDQSFTPVPNAIVYLSTVNATPLVTMQDTTDAMGNYSFTLPSSISPNTHISISTASCGIMQTDSVYYMGSSLTLNFIICGSGPATGPDTINGTVTLGNTTMPGYPAMVYLIEEDYDTAMNSYTLTAVDSTFTTSTGDYSFIYQNTFFRPLLVKAALLPTASAYLSYLPTYHDTSLNWNWATVVPFSPWTADIQMVAGVNPGGLGFIGGLVIQGANKTTGVGDPLDKRLILLTTASNTPVAYTYSDNAGNFSFSGIAYGTYKLFGDIWGKTNPPLTVTISAAAPSVSNVVFEENTTDFTGHIGTTGISTPAALSSVKLYPNPVTNQLTVSGLGNIKGTKSVSLLTVTGAVVIETSFTEGSITIPCDGLASGMYLLKVITNEGTADYKITK